MAAPSLQAIVFDAYGTLLDVYAAMRRHADRLPPDWERMGVEWRVKQLEYTWIGTLTGDDRYQDFWTLTQASLDWVLARHRVADDAVRATLLATYRQLPAFPDAKPALTGLRALGYRTAILSNGEPGMLADAVAAAGLDSLLDAVISVDTIRTYKPRDAVYRLAERALRLPAAEIGFVSSNAWDAQAAARAGFRVFWCNRAGNPAEYGLDRDAVTVDDLAGLEAALAKEIAA